jgi:hypothetical protein
VNANRAILVLLTVAAAAIATTVGALQGAGALIRLALDAAPFLLVLALLVRGRFVGEQHFIARRRAVRAARRRPARRPWPQGAELAPVRQLDRGARPLRGPPRRVLAA